MKKSTKILLSIFFITLILGFVFSKSIISGIVTIDNKIVFKFDTKATIGLSFIAVNIVIGSILFFRFLNILTLDKVLLLTSVPLVVSYGLILFFLAYLNSVDNDFSNAIKSFLNITQNNTYNLILWAVILSIIFISLLFLNYKFICRPIARIERIVSRLGDGIIREGRFNLGGGKQFSNIEHGLNKINNNYRESESGYVQNYNSNPNKLPKQIYRVIGRSGVIELGRGKDIRKRVTLMKIKIGGSDKTVFSEKFDSISHILDLISQMVIKYNGYVSKYSSDGLIVVFGKNENAIECEQMICKIIDKKINHKDFDISSNVKISLVCDAVNFGLSIEGSRPILQILSNISILEKVDEIARFMSARAIFAKNVIDELPLSYRFKYRYIGKITEHEKDIFLFEDLEGYSKDIKEKLFKIKGVFERGILEYDKGDYYRAKVFFEEALKEYPADRASYVYFSKSKEKCNN